MNKNVTVENIPVDQLVVSPDLKPCDQELINLMVEVSEVNFNSELSEPTFQNGLAYLDSLCSLRFDKLPRNDKRHLVKVMDMVIKKTKELMAEARRDI